MAEKRVQFNNVVQNQLPQYVRNEFPLIEEFLKQYYIAQEFDGAPIDLIQNIDQYINLDETTNLIESVELGSNLESYKTTIEINKSYTTDGFPDSYGLLKIGDEIITYTGKTDYTFTGCVRGFSGISSYISEDDPEQLVFESTTAKDHLAKSKIHNLSNLFLKQFLKKTKRQFLPLLDDRNFDKDLDQSTFIKQSKDFFSSRGTDRSFEILFKSLYNKEVEVVKPREFLFTPSNSDYRVTNDLIVEAIEGDPTNLELATLIQQPYAFGSGIDKAYAPITQVEKIVSKDGENFYQLSIDAGYSRDISVDGATYGKFSVIPRTKNIGQISAGSTFFDVDSTVGFGTTGELSVTYNDASIGIVSYTSKSLTQFYGVTNVTSTILDGTNIGIDTCAYGQSTLDQTERIKVRINSVIDRLEYPENAHYYNAEDTGNISALGRKSRNFKTNNWFYNNYAKYNVKSVTLVDASDQTWDILLNVEHSFKVSDSVTITGQDGADKVGQVTDITSSHSLTIKGQGALNIAEKYTIFRNITKTSAINFVKAREFACNVQNVYENNKEILVASSSLPGYTINSNDRTVKFSGTFVGEELEITTGSDHGLYTGDAIWYTPNQVEQTSYDGWGNPTTNYVNGEKLFNIGLYFVKRISSTIIKVAKSRTDIFNGDFVEVESATTVTDNTLQPYAFKDKTVESQKLLRKIAEPINDRSVNEKTIAGGYNGILSNGVEILNYKSLDQVHYGKIEKIDVLDPGLDYDVINPPSLLIEDSVGTGATGNVAVRGILSQLRILGAGFDYLDVPNVKITGGNGTPSVVSVSMKNIDHSVEFFADGSSAQVGLGTTGTIDRTIGFSTFHKFRNGERVIYDSVNQQGVGGMTTNAEYYVSTFVEEGNTKESFTQIKLYPTLRDVISGINTVELTSFGVGKQSLRSFDQKSVVAGINVVSGGTYENKERRVASATGVSSSFNEITITDHDYKDGEVIKYTAGDISIGGLTDGSDYYVLKVDDNKFKLANVGVGTTNGVDYFYQSGQYVGLSSVGVGTHTFNYPPISVTVSGNVGVASTGLETFQASVQPIIRGQITSVNLHNQGSGYGSGEIINHNRKPDISLISGSQAQVLPIVVNGTISEVIVLNKGKKYSSPPDIRIEGDGKGATVTPIVSADGLLSSVTVVEPGSGYTQQNTSGTVVFTGRGVDLDAKLQTWTVNLVKKLESFVEEDDGFVERGINREFGLQYSHLYAPRKFRESVYAIDLDGNTIWGQKDLARNQGQEQVSDKHSPIIGWAYDGHPIYGPYGYVTKSGGLVTKMKSGYIEEASKKANRPSLAIFPAEFFVEDFTYKLKIEETILDENNGRFCVTPEYPNGTYAYFATIDEVAAQTAPFTGYFEPVFPYFIGDAFHGRPNEFNLTKSSNQDEFDLNKTDYFRNTKPYNLIEGKIKYKYLTIPNNLEQTVNVKGVTAGKIENIGIVTSGSGYKVNDELVFNNDGTKGSGVAARVSKVKGKSVDSISVATSSITSVEIYPTGKNEYTLYSTNPHSFNNLDIISLTGLSTSTTGLEGHYVAGVTTTTYVFAGVGTTGGGGIGTHGASGIVTHFNVVGRDLGFDQIRENDIVGIGSEEVRVLEVLKGASALRVERASNGVSAAHTAGAVMTLDQRKIKIRAGFKTDYEYKINRQYYFNPSEAVGLGSTAGVGIGTTIFFTGITSTNLGISSIYIPTQALYLPDHNLATGDKVTYSPGNDGRGIEYSDSGHNISLASTSGVYRASDGQEFYVARFSDTLVGLATVRVGLGTTGIYVGLQTGSFGGRNQTPVYFRALGVGNSHSIKTNYTPITGEIIRNLVTVDTGISTHGLHVGHNVDVTVNAGASTSFVFQYDDYHRKLIINPREFTGGDVTTTTDSITIKDHNITTGQKLIHSSEGPAEGLINNQIYYAVRVDKNTIKLSDTYYNSIQGIPEVVGIGTTGVGGTIKPINPPLSVYRDATVTFTLDDGSLAYTVQGTQYSAFQLNFYKDSEFAYQYDKNDLEKNFNVQRSGQVGIDGTAKVTLTVNKDTPKLLYYKLDPVELSSLPIVKSEINVDTEVDNNNKFETKTSLYDGTFRVSSGIGNTQFSYSITRIPEKTSYLSTDNAFITYETDCSHTTGPIAEVEIKDGGKNYYTLPGITTITTGGGKNAILEPSSTSIGRIKTNKINKIGFDLSVDKTVRPSVVLPNIIKIDAFASFDSIGITSQGRGYSAAPHLIVLDGKDNTLVDDVDLKYTLGDTSVKILKNTYGMNYITPKLIPTANTNGVGIKTVGFNTVTKYATVTLDVGFSTANTFPFVVGDKVLIEGISVGVGSTGKGFNSSAYNYKLFTVTSTDPNIGGVGATVSYSLDGDYEDGEIVGLYDDQNSGGRIIAEKTFPIFTPQIKHNDYAVGEIVESDTTSGAVESWDRQNGLLKVSTTDNFVVNERIKGLSSRTEGLASSITSYNSSFELSPTTRVVKGSETVSGFLNNSIQRVQDSLYYQNFSYTLKSEIDYDTWDDAVSSTNHTAGFKKFGDYQLVTPASDDDSITAMPVGVSSNSIEITNEMVGFGNLNCVHDFDNVTENVLQLGGGISSDEIIFSSRILTDYFESKGNRVLLIDDFSGLFNSNPRPTAYTTVDTFPFLEHRSLKYFMFYRDRRYTAERELMVVTLTHDGAYSYMNQYGGIDTKEPIGRFDFTIAGLDGQLQFFPFKYTINDFDIGFIAYTLDDNILGIGTTNLGGVVDIDTSSCTTWSGGNAGFTTTLVSVAHTYRSMKLLVSLTDANNEHQFNELNIVHDNSDVYGVDYGELTTTMPISAGLGFGTYYAHLDGTNMVVDFIPRNNGIGVTINTIQVGIHSNHAQGIGTATLKHALIEGRTTNIAASGSPGITTIGVYDANYDAAYFILQVTDSTNKRYVMSELLMCDDDADKDGSGQTYMVEYGNVESHTGLGTFGTKMLGDTKTLYFKPRAGIAVSVTAYMNAMAFVDDDNDNIDFTNGMIRTGFAQYEGTENSIKREFGLFHDNNPIFEQYFTGNDTNIVSISADTINIPNHFFVTGETIKYKHVGNIGSAIGIAQSNFAGIGNTTLLPEDVFVIKINDDKIKLASSAENALARIPIPLDITSVGIGTSHRFSSTNQNAKVLLTVDNVIQSPVVATSITTVLADRVTSVDDHIKVSGITSFFGSELIKINNEIMKIQGTGIGETNQFRVRRGWMGTQIAAGATGDLVTKVVGNYNIIDNSLTFSEAPFGNVPIGSTTNAPDERDWSGISTGSSFHGRSFMRSGIEDESNETYYRNFVFDTVSNKFDGIEKSFTLKDQGSNITGISTENAIVLVNDVFQGPGASNDYIIEESSGISSVSFTGVAASIGNDVNTANIPLGGVLLSVGSTEGFGYQPLVSAGATAIIVAAGITNPGSIDTDPYFIGVGNSGTGYRGETSTDILTEIASPVAAASTIIYLKNKNSVFGLLNTLNSGYTGDCTVSIGTFTKPINIVSVGGTFVRVGVSSAASLAIPAGTSVKVGIKSATVGFVNIRAKVNELQDGGYIGVSTAAYNPVTGIMAVTTLAEHGLSELDFVKIRDKTLAFSCNAGVGVHTYSGGTVGSAFTDNSNNAYTVTDAAYVGSTGLLTLTIGSHSLTTSNDIWLGANKIVFTCDEDGHATDHPYPRTTDPAYNTGLDILSKTSTTITVRVGIGSTTDAKLYPRESDPVSGRWLQTTNVGAKTFEVQVLDNAPSTNRSTHVFQYAHPNAIILGEKIPEYHVGFATIMTGTGNISTNVSITNTEARFYAKRNISNVGYNSVTGMTTVTTSTPHGLIVGEQVFVSGIAFTCDYKSSVNISNVGYHTSSGIMTVTTSAGHGLTTYGTVASTVLLTGIAMTCGLDNGASEHIYPRTTDPTYNGNKVLEVLSSTQFVVNVGVSTVPTFYKSGGTAQGAIIAPRKTDRAFTGERILRIISPTSFEINSGISTRVHRYARGGTVDKKTEIIIDSPRPYNDIPLYYSSDSVAGVGSNSTVDIIVSSASSVTDFNIDLKGYGYGVNEILTIPTGGLTGIPTTSAFSGNEFQLTVQKVFADEFTGWTVGELQLLDSPAKNFNGTKKAFNLTLAGSIISILAKRGSRINVRDVLLVFVNDVLQVPDEGYTFPGGSIITFTEPPKAGDSCKILFYKGTGDTDVLFVEIIETVKKGDKLTISPNPDKGHPYYWAEDDRTVIRVDSTDKVTTPLYNGPGNTSDETLERPVKWCRQTEDKIIDEIEIGKDRELYEAVINPCAHITKSVGIGSSSIYVTNAQPFFNPANENDQTVTFQDKINFINQDARLPAFGTATVSGIGSISSITITDGGAGYSTATVSVASTVGIGTSTRMFGNVTISAGGTVSGIAITSPGVGYTSSNPPVVLITPPTFNDFEENAVNAWHGDHGIIAGFGTTALTGVTTQFVFDLHIPLNSYLRDDTHAASAIVKSGINKNDYFMVFDSNVGSASTTIRAMDNNSGTVIGIGNSHIDGVYVVREASDIAGPAGYDGLGSTTLRRVICDVQDRFTGYSGITTAHNGNPYLGAFSWGRIDVKSRAGLNSFTAYTLSGLGTNDVTGIQTSMKVQRTMSLKYKNYDT